MIETRNVLDTFTRLVALRYAWAIGPLSRKLTGLIAGLAPDMVADAMRQACRWVYPIDTNVPIDALPFILRLYGLPSYDGEPYQSTLARLRDAMLTHAASGSVDGLLTEFERATGAAGFSIALDSGASYWVRHPEILPRRKYNEGHTYGRGKSYGFQAPNINWTRNAAKLSAYFKPARERFNGYLEPDT